jgi:hypothetical protein
VPDDAVSIEQVADPSESVVAWHRGLPSAVNDTTEFAIGDPALRRVALKTYFVPDPESDGGDALNVVGACPTDRTTSTVLEPKSEVPE